MAHVIVGGTQKRFQKLPDKPSKLILTALADLEEREKDRNIEIYMGEWLTPNRDFFGKVEGCSVCLAGAVMLGKITDDPKNLDSYYDPSYFDNDTRRKLYALNSLREGNFKESLCVLGIEAPDSLPEHYDSGIDFVDYEHGNYDDMADISEARDGCPGAYEDWKTHMLAMAGILEAEGL